MRQLIDPSTTAVLGLYTSATEEDSTNFRKTYPFGEKLACTTIDYYSALFCILKYNAPYIRASRCM
ncbi:hypothetical protein L218DRAFT_965763 [Marasmius fiardii PR-910]|nr:hypothetical protein L218DRAFT_965763 [Marasmius fiardii PR-910]